MVGTGSSSRVVYLAGMTNCILWPDICTGAVMEMGSGLPVWGRVRLVGWIDLVGS